MNELLLSDEAFAALTKFLEDHESDIATSCNDFGELKLVFEETFSDREFLERAIMAANEILSRSA